ncbi:15506_t:CDS:2 [Dentiscutata erythropus]|uniref:15506_t:CDS:1 n=1 Tax=Dentiscutata erythropus TaxID=1348616 RepID=A0A9N8ZCV7_9GLOM|nr:15506_t:CDS:2 [Dentiscutata erythropus]
MTLRTADLVCGYKESCVDGKCCPKNGPVENGGKNKTSGPVEKGGRNKTNETSGPVEKGGKNEKSGQSEKAKIVDMDQVKRVDQVRKK